MPSNAYGKVPQSIECFLKNSKIKQKQSLLKNVWYSKEQKDSKGTTKEQNVPKENQAEPRQHQKFNPKGAKEQENHSKSSFFPMKFFLQNYKNGHGALVGITGVKGTSVDEFF